MQKCRQTRLNFTADIFIFVINSYSNIYLVLRSNSAEEIISVGVRKNKGTNFPPKTCLSYSFVRLCVLRLCAAPIFCAGILASVRLEQRLLLTMTETSYNIFLVGQNDFKLLCYFRGSQNDCDLLYLIPKRVFENFVGVIAR